MRFMLHNRRCCRLGIRIGRYRRLSFCRDNNVGIVVAIDIYMAPLVPQEHKRSGRSSLASVQVVEGYFGHGTRARQSSGSAAHLTCHFETPPPFPFHSTSRPLLASKFSMSVEHLGLSLTHRG
jgi:hypothetical protein